MGLQFRHILKSRVFFSENIESAVYWGLSWLSLAPAAQPAVRHMQIVVVDAA